MLHRWLLVAITLNILLGNPASVSGMVKALGNQSSQTKLTVLYTGDTYGFHGREGLAGGFARRKKALDSVREEVPNAILLDNGNALGQSYYSRLDQGALAVQLMTELKYQVLNLGVHEFDYGQQRLLQLSKDAGLPLVSTNIQHQNNSALAPTVIHTVVSDVRIAILGVCDPAVEQKTVVGQFKGLKALSPPSVLRSQVKVARAHSDVVILLANLDMYESVSLAQEIPGIDLLISRSPATADEYGHNPKGIPHKFLRFASTQNASHETLLVMVSRYGYHLGRVDLSLKRDQLGWQIEALEPSVIPLSQTAPMDSKIADQVARHVHKLKQKFGKVLLENVQAEFPKGFNEQVLFHVLLSAMRTQAASEVAFINENAFSKLDYTKERIFQTNQIHEFDLHRLIWTNNHLIKGILTGQQLKDTYKQRATMLYSSGLQEDITGLLVNGRPLNVEERYTIATSNYLVSPESPIAALKTLEKIEPIKKNGAFFILRDLMRQALNKGHFESEEVYPAEWRLLFDQIGFSISNLQTHGDPRFGQIRDARIQAVDLLTLSGSGRIELRYDRKFLDWVSTAEARFLQVTIADELINNPQDLVRAGSEVVFKPAWSELLQFFLQANYDSEITSAGPAKPRHQLVRFVPGVSSTWWGLFREMKLGPSLELDASLPKLNLASGIYASYRLYLPIGDTMAFASDLEIRYLPFYKIIRPDSILLAGEIRGQLLIPLVGDLHLSPHAEYFIYQRKGLKKTGHNFLLGIGIAYHRFWKPQTQSLF